MIKLIVGLSNPGKKYIKTRHNAGAWYVSLLAKRLRICFHEEKKFFGFTSHINSDIHLLLPTTSMNLSGKSVVAIMNFYHINPSEILVVHDDLDLSLGVIKFKLGGGHGGHNGLKDIINKLDNNSNFYRLRIGIGHPGDKSKVINFVLGQPSVFEQKHINNAIRKAVSFTKIWIKEDLTKVINHFYITKTKMH